MTQVENSDDAAIGIFIAVFFGGLAAIVAAIVWGIMLYTAPYPGVVFLVPFMALAGIGYGTAYLLDHNPKRRLITALFAAVAGSAVFLVALYLIARNAPVLWNAGALLCVLGFFLVFAILPTIGVCFGIGLSCADLRAALLGETLVDVAALPSELVDPIRPYLEALVHSAPWRRCSLTGLFDEEAGERELYRITPAELKGLFDRVCELAGQRETACRREVAALEAESARDAACSRETFLASLASEERGLLEARLRVTADARDEAARLAKENASLSRKLAAATKENEELKATYGGWLLYLRKHSEPEEFALQAMLAAGERKLGKLTQRRTSRRKETRHAA